MSPHVTRKKTTLGQSPPDYGVVLADVVRLVDAARQGAVRSINAIMTATYWAIGRRIVEQEQHGAARADYGEELIVRLSADLQARFGPGFGRANLFQMRAFYLAYREILQNASGESGPKSARAIVQTASGQLVGSDATGSSGDPVPVAMVARRPAACRPRASFVATSPPAFRPPPGFAFGPTHVILGFLFR